MNATRDRGAGERIEEIVGSGAFWRRAADDCLWQSRCNEQAASQRKSGLVAFPLHILRLGKGALAIQRGVDRGFRRRRDLWSAELLARIPGPAQAGAGSIFPEALEPIRRQRGVAHRGRNRAVPEVMLDGPRVVSVVG